MALVAGIAHGQQMIIGDLPLKRQHEIFGIRDAVAVVEKGIGSDWRDGREIEIRERVRPRNVMRRKIQREGIGVLSAVARVDVRSSEERRRGAEIVVPDTAARRT